MKKEKHIRVKLKTWNKLSKLRRFPNLTTFNDVIENLLARDGND